MMSESSSDAKWTHLCELMLIMARGMMRGRDRDRRESIDVVQSLSKDLMKDPQGLLAMPAEEQRKFLQVALRHKLAALARHDLAEKRGGGRIAATLDGQSEEPDRSLSPSPGSMLVGRGERELMREALDRLDAESRAVLALHALGVPAEVVADQLTSTHAAVRQRYVRAKRDLLIFVRRRGGEPAETIAADVGLTAEQVEHRFTVLESAQPK